MFLNAEAHWSPVGVAAIYDQLGSLLALFLLSGKHVVEKYWSSIAFGLCYSTHTQHVTTFFVYHIDNRHNISRYLSLQEEKPPIPMHHAKNRHESAQNCPGLV